MEKDQDHKDFIDSITGFTMRQASRRGFIRWVAKGGVALAAAMTTGIDLLTRKTYAYVDCGKWLPGCQGVCTCDTSECVDPDTGGSFYCEGNCVGGEGCGGAVASYYVLEYWFYGYKEAKCLSVQVCVEC